MQSEVDLRMMEDPLIMMEIVMGRIGTPHKGVKNTDIPICDEGMDHQGTVPLKEGIIGKAHKEVVSLEEIQASLEGISPPMTKITTITMVMEVMGEALYAQHIWEQVGQPTGQFGPEVKAMGVPKPGKYKGQNDLEEFNNWLGQLLKYFYESPLPRKDKGKAVAKPQLYAVDVQEDAEHKHACVEDKVEEVPDNPDNDEEVQAYEGTTEMYLVVDEEDEPVAYFGTMDPKDEPLEEEVVYCASIHAEVQEGQMPSKDNALMQEDDPLI
ncbi:hypothetical protein M404DRAFT_30592 [Pisolithus tinctorius Marx 270]|uniref:Uncharacterized protein n=1 Tax=Pisolithus tinctorius Marx 270 TaxID=870435 RepID=A0A0C3NE42_PISTI|nr:hypothetical protein M404DRAFT_30592 [Pisolithus tinctorius Marx 270]